MELDSVWNRRYFMVCIILKFLFKVCGGARFYGLHAIFQLLVHTLALIIYGILEAQSYNGQWPFAEGVLNYIATLTIIIFSQDRHHRESLLTNCKKACKEKRDRKIKLLIINSG